MSPGDQHQTDSTISSGGGGDESIQGAPGSTQPARAGAVPGGKPVRKPGAVEMISRMSLQLIVTAAVIVAGYFGWKIFEKWMGGGSAPATAAYGGGSNGPALEVHAVKLTPQDVPMTLDYIGQTQASITVDIRARVAGFLESRQFTEGTLVQANQVLYTIERDTFEANVAVGKANVEAAKARVYRAQQQVNRYAGLVKQGAATEPELEEQQMELQVAQADLDLAKANLTKAQLDLSYTTVISPLRGMIGRTMKDVGSYVDNAANSLLAQVQQVDPIYVTFNVSDDDVQQLKDEMTSNAVTGPTGDSVRTSLTLSDGTKYAHTGTINFVGVEIDPSTNTALMRAIFPNPDYLLKPGQFVHVQMLGFTHHNAIVVPKESITQNPTGAFVYTLDSGNKVKAVIVSLGQWTDHGWIIKSGLAAGDRVLTDSLLKVRQDMVVNPVVTDQTGVALSESLPGDSHGAGKGAEDPRWSH